ncbi:succinylglutamate desuccinylase [Adhaeribacter aerolatus]|uniref:Succinylglutamate desuccinylase n=1 Tax=Adhaeribacter aerolatus TaxID=670289 RepID=A0A512B424_9BACT|nr:succinylglutamate desuccinylase/aspartoacylase family protein [Adhaeribacter aerolatus]GEO06711.1 succinylglutamate desuccinylase [Adhaeribacter aerolatus]
MPQVITINGQNIGLGQQVLIRLNISRLPSGTVIDIPVHVFRAPEDGPVLLLMAGMHGDEVNGIETVRRMLRRKMLRPARGTIIAIPVLNIYGFLNFSREVPDGKDVNRSFPGSEGGSLASRVAHKFVREILPWVDYGIDFHTGGASRANYPQVRCLLSNPVAAQMAYAFAAPFVINANLRPKSLRKEASKYGKNIIVFEGGESLRFDEAGIQEGINGTIRVLAFLQIQKSNVSPGKLPKVCQRTSWVRAKVAGLFRSQIALGDYIQKSQVIGSIADPYGQMSVSLKAPKAGYVIGLNRMPVVNQGDALLHLGLL